MANSPIAQLAQAILVLCEYPPHPKASDEARQIALKVLRGEFDIEPDKARGCATRVTD